MITIKIYKLINPINRNVFYIGKTVKTLDQRLSAHIKDKEANNSKRLLINSIINKNLLPIIELIESHTFSNDEEERVALLREDFWIKEYSKKYELCNGIGIINPRLLKNYAKETYKTKPMGIRFDEKQFEFIKNKEGLKTAQQVVSFLMNAYIRHYDKT